MMPGLVEIVVCIYDVSTRFVCLCELSRLDLVYKSRRDLCGFSEISAGGLTL